MNYLTLEDYLKSRGVILEKRTEKKTSKEFSEGNVYFQLNLISKVHKILKEYPEKYIPSIKSIIGEEYEGIKVLNKRINRYLSDGYFPGNLENKVENIINLANLSLEKVKDSSYLTIFKRAMKNKEITLGYCDDRNLNYNKGIVLFDLTGLAYNFVESDYAKYLLKIKKSGNELNFLEAIDFLVSQEDLDYESREYLKGYISFPLDSMKILQKYKEGKKQWNEETFYYKFMKAYEFDNSITLL